METKAPQSVSGLKELANMIEKMPETLYDLHIHQVALTSYSMLGEEDVSEFTKHRETVTVASEVETLIEGSGEELDENEVKFVVKYFSDIDAVVCDYIRGIRIEE